MANPLTAAYGIAHGEAVALMLPHVVRRNGREVDDAYRCLMSAATEGQFPDPAGGAEALADFLTTVAAEAGLATKLRDLGVEPSA